MHVCIWLDYFITNVQLSGKRGALSFQKQVLNVEPQDQQGLVHCVSIYRMCSACKRYMMMYGERYFHPLVPFLIFCHDERLKG